MENKCVTEACKVIDQSIENLKIERKKIEESINALSESKTALYRANNICPICNGSGDIVTEENDRSDPYAKSPDFRGTCPRCNGTGKYKE